MCCQLIISIKISDVKAKLLILVGKLKDADLNTGLIELNLTKRLLNKNLKIVIKDYGAIEAAAIEAQHLLAAGGRFEFSSVR